MIGSEVAISIQGLSKRYRRSAAKPREKSAAGALARTATAPVRRVLRGGQAGGKREWFWALDDVSFEVARGEALGLVGHNGAGKSTLLKILSRMTVPTKGRAVIRGQVGSMLELGVGFNMELTGRENVFLSGVVLGRSRREMRRRFDEIVEFAGVEAFINEPVKRYSSGMRVRLGFAVMSTLEPEVLLVDEVLGVGDQEFQNRSRTRMRELLGGGRTVLIVSHAARELERLCERVVLLDHGRVARIGPAHETLDEAGLLDARVTMEGVRDPKPDPRPDPEPEPVVQ